MCCSRAKFLPKNNPQKSKSDFDQEKIDLLDDLWDKVIDDY